MIGPLELFTRGKVLALGSDALEVIRVVLEAVRGVRRTLGHHVSCIPVLGLVRLREPGYDGTGQGAGAGRPRKSLTVKTSSLEDVFASENSKISRGKGGGSGKSLRGEVRVGHCRSVFAVKNKTGWNDRHSPGRPPPWTHSRPRSRQNGRQSKTTSKVPQSICAEVTSNVSRPRRSRRHARRARSLQLPK